MSVTAEGNALSSSSVTTSNSVVLSSQPNTANGSIARSIMTNEAVPTQSPEPHTITDGDPRPLPLSPKITPGVGFAGAVLIITGLCYGLLGIGNKILYRFFGVAYLSSLAVFVLILYCMNPPVSDGVQGGFVVATIFAGTLTAGASLLFPDVIEGLGCLLGGFCFSMWLLCLKEGGLIKSKAGKIILIACLSLAAFSLSFNHYTRTYGLIACIPFSGGTAAILGIDCFSRAGLKEFYIYIWEINDDEFPNQTNTYPITRGMRVETAGVILIFLLGLISHVRLSKIGELRRKQKKKHQSQQEKDLEQEDMAVGQMVEQDVGQERAQWEAVYGGNKRVSVTTPTGTNHNGERNFGTQLSTMQDVEVLQTDPTQEETAGQDSTGAGVTELTAQGEEHEIEGIGRKSISDTSVDASSSNYSTLSRSSSKATITRTAQNSATPAQNPMPLLSTVPEAELEESKSSPKSLSLTGELLRAGRLSSDQNSGSSSMYERSFANSTAHGVNDSKEELWKSQYDSSASSVAATIDDLYETHMALSEVSLPASPQEAHFGPSLPISANRTSLDPLPIDIQPVNPVDGIQSCSDMVFELDSGYVPAAVETSTERPSSSNATRETELPAERNRFESSLQNNEQLSRVSQCASEIGDERKEETRPGDSIPRNEKPLAIGTSGQIMEAASEAPVDKSQFGVLGALSERSPGSSFKAYRPYRTNEWAKRLCEAEDPGPYMLAEPPSSRTSVETILTNAASLDCSRISPREGPRQSTLIVDSGNTLSATSASQDGQGRSLGSQSKLTLLNDQQSPRSPSQSPNKNLQLVQYKRLNASGDNFEQGTKSRVSHSYAPTQRLRSTIEPQAERELMQTTAMIQGSGRPRAPRPESTLLGQRHSLIHYRHASISLAQSTPNLVTTPYAGAPSQNGGRDHRQDTDHSLYMTALNQSAPGLRDFDSHQPKRNSSSTAHLRRESMLSSWRESLYYDQNPLIANLRAPAVDESRRQQMINEKRQSQRKEQIDKMKQAARDDQFDRAMRNASMIDAHKRAMHKMQSGAN